MATVGRAARLQSVSITGLREAKEALGAIPEAMRFEVALTIRQGAGIIEADYRRRIRKRTGETAQSIGMNVREDGLQAAVGAGDPVARFLELGTFRTRRYPALYPAFLRGARHVRRQMRGWVPATGNRVRFKTRRHYVKLGPAR